MPKYATARIDIDGSLLLPRLPGVSAVALSDRPETLDCFKKMVSMMMNDITERPMMDQKDEDIFVVESASGDQVFLPLDFGEFGMYRLMDEAAEVYNCSTSPPSL